MVTEFYRPSRVNFRKMGWALAACGLALLAVTLPVSAWIARRNEDIFQQKVGWANILALTVGAFGVIVSVIDKVGAIGTWPDSRIADTADKLAEEVLRQETASLAKLLGTDTLDRRPASTRFVVGNRARKKRNNSQAKSIEEIVPFYLGSTRRRMVVLGPPGAGKTVLGVSLITGLIEERRNAVSRKGADCAPVPVLFNLASWNPSEKSLVGWLQSQLAEQFRLGYKISSRLVRDGLILPVLDGLDEMDRIEDSPRRSELAIQHMNDHIASTVSANIVVICRSGPKYYERLTRKIRDADEITLQRLESDQIIEYVKMQCQSEEDLVSWEPIFDNIRHFGSSLVKVELDTPWRLTTAMAYYFNGGDPSALLPTPEELSATPGRGRNSDYSNRIRCILMEQFLLARSYLHQEKRFPPRLTIQWLEIIVKRMKISENNGGRGSEIVLHEWWRSFGTYKMLRRHGYLTWGVLHIPFAVAGFAITSSSMVRPGDWFTAIAILVNYATIMMIATERSTRRKRPVVVSLGTLRDWRRGVVVTVGILMSIGLGALLAGDTQDLAYGIGMALSLSAVMVLAGCASPSLHRKMDHPLEPLSDDRNFAILAGLVVGSYAFLYYVDLYGVPAAGIFASMCLLGGLCASVYMRYLLAAFYGSIFGLPLSFSRFLSWGHSAGILRLSGAGYQFRHQELVDHLQER